MMSGRDGGGELLDGRQRGAVTASFYGSRIFAVQGRTLMVPSIMTTEAALRSTFRSARSDLVGVDL
jgi:hypothetical protein